METDMAGITSMSNSELFITGGKTQQEIEDQALEYE
jgi:hypothetical protein